MGEGLLQVAEGNLLLQDLLAFVQHRFEVVREETAEAVQIFTVIYFHHFCDFCMPYLHILVCFVQYCSDCSAFDVDCTFHLLACLPACLLIKLTRFCPATRHRTWSCHAGARWRSYALEAHWMGSSRGAEEGQSASIRYCWVLSVLCQSDPTVSHAFRIA